MRQRSVPSWSRQRGTTLALALVAAIIVSGALAALTSLALAQTRDARRYTDSVDAVYLAHSNLELAKQLIVSGSHTPTAGTAVPGTGVSVTGLTGGTLLLTATEMYDTDATRQVAQQFSMSQSLANYLYFSDLSRLTFRSSRRRGAIHTNNELRFSGAGGEYGPDVSTSLGISYLNGAAPDNTTLHGTVDPARPPIDIQLDPLSGLPQLDVIASATVADFSFDNTADTRIRLYVNSGQQMLAIERWSGGSLVSQQDVAAPANGHIYSTGLIEVHGEVIGRLTIASQSSIRIVDSIVYRDASGQSAYLNGDDYSATYEPNPNYDHDAALGLIAQNDILWNESIPQSFEVNAAIAAIDGSIKVETTDYLRESLRVLGSVTSRRGILLGYLNGSGDVVSGFKSSSMVYDGGFLDVAPPGYPEVRVADFHGLRVE